MRTTIPSRQPATPSVQHSALRTPHSALRGGFTLVELMIVIGIIALMIALAAVAVTGYLATAKEKATASTIAKIAGLLEDRMQAFNRLDLRKERIAYMPAAGNNPTLAEVLARKNRFEQEFPQTFAEATLALQRAGRTPPNPQSIDRRLESAQVLYFILTQSSVIGYSPETTDGFAASQIRTPENPALADWPYFVDAWDQPIRFYRWPTRLVRPQGLVDNGGNVLPVQRTYAEILNTNIPPSNQDLNRDPDDPTGLTEYLYGGDPVEFERNYHTRDTYHTPLVVSAGPDQVLGLHEPGEITINSGDPTQSIFGNLAQPKAGETEAITDNITNLNRQAGG